MKKSQNKATTVLEDEKHVKTSRTSCWEQVPKPEPSQEPTDAFLRAVRSTPWTRGAFSLPFLHQNWLKRRKGKKKDSKPGVEAPTAQLWEKEILSPQIP